MSYDSRLGPRPGSTLRGEETTLIRKMLADQISGRWVPQARMQHFIPKERMTVEYLKGFYFGQGEGFTRISRLGFSHRPLTPYWRSAATFLKHRFLYEWKRHGHDSPAAVRHLIASSKALGSLRERLRPFTQEP